MCPPCCSLTVELLALIVRNSENLGGVYIGQTEWRISQFTDDTTCFADSQGSLAELSWIIERFSNFSGLRLNLDKCAILAPGPSLEIPASIQGINVQDKVKILGVCFAKERSQEQHTEWNFSPQLSKMRAICSSWSNRRLSLKGKVTVFNTLISSLIQYMVMNKITPPGVVTEVRKSASAFIWEGEEA